MITATLNAYAEDPEAAFSDTGTLRGNRNVEIHCCEHAGIAAVVKHAA